MPEKRSCGFLVFRRSAAGLSFLLLKRKQGGYDLPKGHMEEGETQMQTAFRELSEETSIQESDVTVVPGFSYQEEYYPQYRRLGGARVHKIVTVFACELVSEAVAVRIAPREHGAFEWIPWRPPHFIARGTIDGLLKAYAAHCDPTAGAPPAEAREPAVASASMATAAAAVPSGLVVHCKRSPYDVYIGRPNKAIRAPGTWGNPFKIGPDGDRAAVIAQYETWLVAQPDLVAQAKRELRGKVLACWCAPEACHGDVLARVANS